jgi:poly(beta-D-mannuronate) lyase
MMLLFLLVSFSSNNQQIIKVTNIVELEKAISNAKAGDEIVMANGIWDNLQIKFSAKGSSDNPVVLKAETPGKVFIEGLSDLKLGGQYLVVDGLYFRNGYTPSKSVITFKINDKNIANNCKVINTVIDEFTQLDRDRADHWVEFWGRNNQLDHCYIAGKSNVGPTVRVFLEGNEHSHNYHQVTNNYFGHRPRKGGPKAETMQIGDSSTSMVPSHMNVENNYFERCNGEVEIISSKSNYNVFRNNIFFESEGSLVLRHGNYDIIDGNIFIGNDASNFIGGIRVINTGHWITNNYFYKIKGAEFRSAIAVMNGIPQSPLNRYNQVTDVVVAHNTFIDCKAPWQFSVGANIDKVDVLPKSEIRSERPERVTFANNFIFNHTKDENPIITYDKVDGVLFKQNIINSANKSVVQDKGIETTLIEVKKLSDWLYVPVKNEENTFVGFDFETIKNDLFKSLRSKQNSIGAISFPVNETKAIINKKAYGPSWFSTEKPTSKPKTFQVANAKELVNSVAKANHGDVILLTAKTYKLNQSIEIHKKITLKSTNNTEIRYTGKADSPLFLLLPKANLELEGVHLKGTKEQMAFATLEKNMSVAFNLIIKNTNIDSFKSVLKTYKGSFADTIAISNSTIKNCLNGLELASETDDKGDYNAEFVYVMNSTFENVQKNVIDYYRGGYDESTIGGNLTVYHNKFENCGALDSSKTLIKNWGIVQVIIEKNTFTNNPVDFVVILWGEKGQKPVDNKLINSGEIKVEQNLKQKLMY